MKNTKDKDKMWIPAIVIAVLFAISLLPILYVGLFNYATGDDYWYGIYTYRGWVEGGLLGALKGSCKMVAEFYQNWQGTWFTMFLFTLSPNHFVEGGYVITVFLSLGMLVTSVSYLADYYLVKRLKFRKSTTAIMVCMILFLMIQYIPRTTSGIYWFNGVMHYSVPFLLGVLAIVHSHKFIENKRKKDYVILFLCFTLLGGGSYLAPLAATLIVVLLLISKIEVVEWNLKEKILKLKYEYSNLWILLAFFAELIGLVISFMAPGNNVRGGEEFDADLKWAVKCIYYAIDRGIYLGEDYFLKNAVTTVVFLILAVLLWIEMKKINKENLKFRFPLLLVVYMNGVYWATYTPEIYSRSDVSGGVPNTYFHVFLLITFVNMIYVHGWIQKKIEKRKCTWKINISGKKKLAVIAAGWFMGAVILGITFSFSEIKTTNQYCVEYIESGELPNYVKVRKEQHRILTTSSEKDVQVPEMEARYPLINMCLTENSEEQRNIDRARYYNKNSVTAVKVE